MFISSLNNEVLSIYWIGETGNIQIDQKEGGIQYTQNRETKDPILVFLGESINYEIRGNVLFNESKIDYTMFWISKEETTFLFQRRKTPNERLRLIYVQKDDIYIAIKRKKVPEELTRYKDMELETVIKAEGSQFFDGNEEKNYIAILDKQNHIKQIFFTLSTSRGQHCGQWIKPSDEANFFKLAFTNEHDIYRDGLKMYEWNLQGDCLFYYNNFSRIKMFNGSCIIEEQNLERNVYFERNFEGEIVAIVSFYGELIVTKALYESLEIQEIYRNSYIVFKLNSDNKKIAMKELFQKEWYMLDPNKNYTIFENIYVYPKCYWLMGYDSLGRCNEIYDFENEVLLFPLEGQPKIIDLKIVTTRNNGILIVDRKNRDVFNLEGELLN